MDQGKASSACQRYSLPPYRFILLAFTVYLLGDGICTKIGTFPYLETFECEWSSYFLIYAATYINTGAATRRGGDTVL
jgi:hypothetical protein